MCALQTRAKVNAGLDRPITNVALLHRLAHRRVVDLSVCRSVGMEDLPSIWGGYGSRARRG